MPSESNLTATTSALPGHRQDSGPSPLSLPQPSVVISPPPRPGVMARLHALFPTSPSAMHDQPGAPSPALPKAKPQKFLKVRIATWNMHDSLPKGDLKELLGTINPTQPSYPPGEPALSNLTPDANHPYHLVVVAGQECPTVSGLPRGLGAPGFQRKERDKEKEKEKVKEKTRGKDKEKDKDKDKDRDSERETEEQPLLPRPLQAKDKDAEDRARPRSLHRLHLHRDHSQHGHSKEDLANFDREGTSSPQIPEHNHHPSYGWSAMLEDWHCHGGPPLAHSNHNPNPSTSQLNETPKPPLLDVPINDEEFSVSPKAKSTGDLALRMAPKAAEKGPYELLIKERMMGIYLAVYINRDIKGLVQGTSKGVVTAGLIGGRLGNKGAVGISLNIDGTTLLFINAHLAAHEGKVHHRVANLTKIKSELVVDDFLAPEDPRIMSEDLSDRFDHSFIFGDLNFRLDVTRLHADWLISQKDYAQALAFDQLRKVMQTSSALSGFAEAPIDFPPTFKYDVLRTIKRRKNNSKSYKYFPKTPNLFPEISTHPTHPKTLAGAEEEKREKIEQEKDKDRDRDQESGEGDDPSADSGDGEGEVDGTGEAASLASTAWTGGSRYTTDGDDRDRGRDREDEDEFSTQASTSANIINPSSPYIRGQGTTSPTFSDNTTANTSSNANMSNGIGIGGMASPGNLVQKVWTAAAAHKAKAKFISLLPSSSSPTPGSSLIKAKTPKAKTKGGLLHGRGNKHGLRLNLHLGSRHPHGEVSAPNSPAGLRVGLPSGGIGWTPTPTPGFQTATFPPTPGTGDVRGLEGGRMAEDDERFLKPSRSAASSVEIVRKGTSASVKSTRKSEDWDRGKEKEKERNSEEVVDEDKGVYDSSHKKRVPSWCDRILWKTTVPEESESESEEEEPPPIPPKTGVGRILQALNLRARKDSHTSASSTEATPRDPITTYTSDTEVASDHGHYVIPPPRSHSHISNRLSPRRFSFSRSSDSLPLQPDQSNRNISRSHTQVVIPFEPKLQLQPRKATVPLIHSASAINSKTLSVPSPLPTPYSAQSHRVTDTIFSPLPDTRNNSVPPPVVPLKDVHSPPRWLNFAFRPFLSSREVSPAAQPPPEIAEPEAIVEPPPRKGDVVCLSYDTLDDKAMRRLEGRSDHRPVIGSYAVYI